MMHAVVPTLASHQCGPGSIPFLYVGWVCCWFSPCSESFSLGSPTFLPPQKPTVQGRFPIKFPETSMSKRYKLFQGENDKPHNFARFQWLRGLNCKYRSKHGTLTSRYCDFLYTTTAGTLYKLQQQRKRRQTKGLKICTMVLLVLLIFLHFLANLCQWISYSIPGLSSSWRLRLITADPTLITLDIKKRHSITVYKKLCWQI